MLVFVVVSFACSFLSFLSFPCMQIYITDPATKQLLKEHFIFSLCAVLAIPVWLCCLWLPLWSNFVAIVQISMWLPLPEETMEVAGAPSLAGIDAPEFALALEFVS